MKAFYKYIHFAQLTDHEWVCMNTKKKEMLGTVEFYKNWRQWEFAPDELAVFSAGCLDDISHFMQQLKDPK